MPIDENFIVALYDWMLIWPWCSVAHEVDKWENNVPKLSTCNPNTKQYVSQVQPPQEISAGKDVIFTYDVEFKVGPAS